MALVSKCAHVSKEALVWFCHVGLTYLTEDEKDIVYTYLTDDLVQSPTLDTTEDILEKAVVLLSRRVSTSEGENMTELFHWAQSCENSGDYTKRFREDAPCFKLTNLMVLPRIAIGCSIASLVVNVLRRCKMAPYCHHETHQLCRMRYFMYHFAKKCTYERTGDSFIHTVLRSKLSAWRAVLLPFGETPYDAIADQFKSEANDVVRPLFDVQPLQRIETTEWKNNRDRDLVHFVAGLAREALDYDHFPVFSNTDITVGMFSDRPFMFTLDSALLDIGTGCLSGVGVGSCLYVIGETKCLALDTLRLYLLICGGLFGGGSSLHQGFSDICAAIRTREKLPATNPFRPLSEDLLKADRATF